MAVEGIAHREDDIAVSLVEVAVSTQGHQRQLHFLEGLAEYAAVHLIPAFPQPPSPVFTGRRQPRTRPLLWLLGALSGSTLGLSVLVSFPIASPWSHLQSPGEACELPKPRAGERVGCNCQVTLI